jgi:hypothetical protein
MPLFSRTPCTLRAPGSRDIYGKTTLGPATPALCSIVRFEIGSTKTSVRTDSSASRGNAEETTAAVRLLFPTLYPVVAGTVVEMLGQRLEITSVHPRHAVTGELDHYQVDAQVAETV